ncbi:MAG: zinc ribbon domain-containing protein [Acidobacteriota bacterium]|nr:zinc ribbon domain-containing protein [Acidobacteriota bacterium]MDQ7086401.1 zinc ribbon domain-containing protein [Acidobacteriota bacterium]
MPIYEYQCQKCGHEFEKIQKFSDRPVRRCPECGGKTEKLISRSAFVLKGGGWYADGYSGGSKAKKRAASSSGSSGSDASAGKTSSSKKTGSGSKKE